MGTSQYKVIETEVNLREFKEAAIQGKDYFHIRFSPSNGKANMTVPLYRALTDNDDTVKLKIVLSYDLDREEDWFIRKADENESGITVSKSKHGGGTFSAIIPIRELCRFNKLEITETVTIQVARTPVKMNGKIHYTLLTKSAKK